MAKTLVKCSLPDCPDSWYAKACGHKGLTLRLAPFLNVPFSHS